MWCRSNKLLVGDQVQKLLKAFTDQLGRSEKEIPLRLTEEEMV